MEMDDPKVSNFMEKWFFESKTGYAFVERVRLGSATKFRWVMFNSMFESYTGLTSEQFKDVFVHETPGENHCLPVQWERLIKRAFKEGVMDETITVREDPTYMLCIEARTEMNPYVLISVQKKSIPQTVKPQKSTKPESLNAPLKQSMNTLAPLESEDRFRRMLDHIHGVFFFRSPKDYSIIYVNASYEKVWERSCESLSQNPESFLEDVVQEDRQMVAARYAERKEHVPFEYRIHTKSGQEKWILAYSTSIYNDDEAFMGYLDIQFDITETKRREKGFVFLKEKAEENNLAKTQFLVQMSHDIRTSMNGIVGYLKLLGLNTVQNKEKATYLQGMHHFTDTIMSLMRHLIDFSKLELEKMKQTLSILDVQKEVEDISKAYAGLLREKGVNAIVDIQPGVPKNLVGDRVRLRQVITNLMNNAMKFTEHGEVGIRVYRKRETLFHVLLAFEVWDTGMGIDEKSLPSIFDLFTQVQEGNDPRNIDGSGIGLFICKTLVEFMDGQISVESKKNLGTTFTFTIQFLKNMPDDDEQKRFFFEEEEGAYHVKKEDALTPLKSTNNAKILVVEDNEINQKFLVRLLKKYGFDCTVAQNGKEAIEKYLQEDFSLIFMDCQMPEMDGYETTRKIRELEKGKKHSYICAITAYAMKSDLEACIQAGMDTCLTKPLDIQLFAELLRRIL